MRAFWWFEENAIAGMGRPGFNNIHWFDLPFDEAVLLGWVGQHSTGVARLSEFREHLETYAPKVYKFYGMNADTGRKALEAFDRESGLNEVLDRLARRTGVVGRFEVRGEELHLEIAPDRLHEEIEFLKQQGIQRIVTLTEKHHAKDILEDHFKLHHLGIEDLGAPQVYQARELAGILKQSKTAGEKVAVHCLAGIGRTSTMLMAAHLLLGEKFEDLQLRLSRQNPRFILTGPQGEFIRALVEAV